MIKVFFFFSSFSRYSPFSQKCKALHKLKNGKFNYFFSPFPKKKKKISDVLNVNIGRMRRDERMGWKEYEEGKQQEKKTLR